VKRPGHLAGAGQKEPRPVGPARLSRAPSGSNPQDFPPQSPAPSPRAAEASSSARESPSASSTLPLEERTVAALYVKERGVYFHKPGIEFWGVRRDARNYQGPHPVVAHPPCARWCRLAKQLELTRGLKVGADQGCFTMALYAVRTWGGVLEHPAHSLAWEAHGLIPPAEGWQLGIDGAWTCEVSQAHFGHPLAKHTWLYVVGATYLPSFPWSQVDRRGRRNSLKSVRNGTPVRFRDELLKIARSVPAK
jgi:hypothetical protein